MRLGMYSVYDQVADSFITPFFLPNDEMAKRTFTDTVNDLNHLFNKNPGDYSLYRVMYWDTDGSIHENKNGLNEYMVSGNTVYVEKPVTDEQEDLVRDYLSAKMSDVQTSINRYIDASLDKRFEGFSGASSKKLRKAFKKQKMMEDRT